MRLATILLDYLQAQLSKDSALSATDNQAVYQQLSMLIESAPVHDKAEWAAHMTSAVDEQAFIGHILAGQHHGNLLSAELYPQLSEIERQVMAFFCPLFGQSYAHATHGGSYANLEALWQARKQFGAYSKTVYASDQCHYSITKACDILELNLQLIPSNNQQQIDIHHLEKACKQQAPMAIIGTIGTTSSGQIDDVPQISQVVARYPCWLHLDAAWGGFLSLVDTTMAETTFSQADSVCFDPHKSLGVPRPCSLLLYQKPPLYSQASTSYLQQTPRDVLPGSYGAELLLPLWLMLKLQGKAGLAARIQSTLQQAKLFTDYLTTQEGWWVQHSPTAIVCFTPPNNIALTELVRHGVFSTTTLQQKTVYRAVFAGQHVRSNALVRALAPFL